MAATDVGIFELTSLGAAPAPGDVLVLVDISDPTDAPQGTTKNMTVANLFTSPNITTSLTVTGANSAALAVGRLGATTPAFQVSTATALQVAGVQVTGAVTGGTVAIQVIDSGGSANLAINAKGSGTITLGSATNGLGDFSIATNKFTVAAFNGNTMIAGSLNQVGDFAVNTSKFQVDSATGNTIAAGKVTVGPTSAANLIVAGGGAAIATNATVGFLMVSSCAGIPIGTPASIPTGTIPCVYDTSNNKIWFYNSSWRGVAVV